MKKLTFLQHLFFIIMSSIVFYGVYGMITGEFNLKDYNSTPRKGYIPSFAIVRS